MPDTLSREKGAFVRVLREYADRANDNFSQKVVVPEHVLRDGAAAIEDQRAHIDALTAAVEQNVETWRTFHAQDVEDGSQMARISRVRAETWEAVLAMLRGEQ